MNGKAGLPSNREGSTDILTCLDGENKTAEGRKRFSGGLILIFSIQKKDICCAGPDLYSPGLTQIQEIEMKSGRIINALTAVILSLCLAGCGGTMQASAPELEMGQEESTGPEAPAEGEAEEASGEDTEESEEGEESLSPGEEAGEDLPVQERRIYSSEQIMDACIYHCLSRMDQWYQLSARMTDGVEEDDIYGDEDSEVEVQLYEPHEVVDATIDWYTIDTATWKGTDFFGNEIDLSEALSSLYCDRDLRSLMTAAGCLFSSIYEGVPQDLVIREDDLEDVHMDSYAVMAFYRMDTDADLSEMKSVDNYFPFEEEEIFALFRNALGPDADKYLERAVLEGEEDEYPVLIRMDDGRYGIMGLTLTDPMYFFRPVSETADPQGEERTVTAELVYSGNTLARSEGMYEITLARDPKSAFGWSLSRIRAAEPDFTVKSITASSALEGYLTENLTDQDPGTTWAEDEAGYGEGSEITLRAEKLSKVHGIRFGSGFLKSMSLYEENGCPSKYTIILDDKTVIIPGDGWVGWDAGFTPLRLDDPDSVEDIINGTDYENYIYTDCVSFGREFTAREITIRIDKVRPGTRYQDTCISEIYVY